MALSYKQKVEAFCAEHNITLDDNCGHHIDFCITTPKGLMLKGVGDHTAVTHFPRSEGTKQDGWKGVWEDLSYGLAPCDVKNCEFCAQPDPEPVDPLKEDREIFWGADAKPLRDQQFVDTWPTF